VVSLSLAEVLRLADAGNAQIAQARARVDASIAADEVAGHSHLPNVLRKEAYRRTVAEAKVWQQRVELARVRSEVLQDAGNTYVDWLTALRGEAVAKELETYDEKLLTKARALAKDEKGARALLEGVETSLTGHKQARARLHQQAEGAAAKLAYLLNKGGKVPLDSEIMEPVDLVEVSVPVETLILQAQQNGPGVQELRALEGVIATALADARCLHIACNLTGWCSICGRIQEAEARLREVHLAGEELSGKLEAGIREGRSAVLSGRDQIALGAEQIRHAVEGYRLSDLRLTDSISSQNLNAVQQSIRGLEASHLAYIQAVSAYNKAEVRLAILLGQGGSGTHSAP
jgi:outer membrane protein TolC